MKYKPKAMRPTKGRPTYVCQIGSCDHSGQNKPCMYAHARRHLRTCIGCPYCEQRCFNSESWERHVSHHGPGQFDKKGKELVPHPRWDGCFIGYNVNDIEEEVIDADDLV